MKYVLAVAVGAFVAGVSALIFIDTRMEGKLEDYAKLEEVESQYITKPLTLPEGIVKGTPQATHLPGNLIVENNRWDGSESKKRVHTSVEYCPEGWYVVGMRGIDTDGGKYCTSCISDIEFVCRKL